MFSSVFIVNEKPKILSTYRPGNETKMKLVAIASSDLGKGKILILGSSAYFKKPMINDAEVIKGIDGILNWAKPSNKPERPLIGIYGDGMEDFLSYIKNKSNCYQIDGKIIRKKTAVIFLTQDITDSLMLKNLHQYIKRGGTLVFGSPYGELSWDRKSSYPIIQDLKINSLFLKAGFCNNPNRMFAARFTEKRLSADTIPPYLHPQTLLPWLAKNDPNKIDYLLQPLFIDPTIKLMVDHNEVNSHILKQVKQVFKYADSSFFPSKENPVKINNNEQVWGYRFNQLLAEKKYVNKVGAKAENYINFPGKVTKESPRIKNEEVTIPVRVGNQGLSEPHPTYFRPHSTGFYVPAGERVVISLNKSYTTQQLKAQIGVHNDDISELEVITRDGSDLTRTFELNKTKTEIYSPYGGLLLISIPDSSTLKSVGFSLTGAVRAPHFDLYKTSEEEWLTTIRNYPAPWAELATENIVFTIPSARIRTLDQPGRLLEFWDKVMNANAELADISPKRVHPERIIVDSDVAYGYMFTTRTKIVVPDDESTELMLDVNRLEKEGSWGHIHEIGHRHQFKDIDFSGLTEITVNLFTLFTYHQVLNQGLFDNEKFPNKQALTNKVESYLKTSPSFKTWKKDSFLALSMYVQLIDSFGWEPIKKVFRKYRTLPKEAYPKSDQDKIDLWFTSICDATNSNLTDFFDIWQIPVSKDSKQKVKEYKTWLPQEMLKYSK
ncbi:M60 family metallopeptidase [Pedobacter gandavensis]|uniref:M60 family metallopeptidase n=1 Tax=Pedobacter gandavensis TaxID=2679963 RepID=UPI00292EF0E8|nr:M60 family metallopeptidase [Pedobacter gandavensis]